MPHSPSAIGRVALCAVLTAACVFGVEAQDLPDSGKPRSLAAELSGHASAEGRGFPAGPPFPDQRSLATGFVVMPTLHIEHVNASSFTLTPFFRYDHSDARRTHFDMREAYLMLFGDAGSGGWEARLGVGQVFWGVTESQRLVDIVNQVDFVEHPGGEAKLGQPMAHLTWFGDWGSIEVIGMPFHRARTFPGRHGRLRLPLTIDRRNIEYESEAGRWHFDVASRYSNALGAFDLGVSVFEGTSREPFLLPGTRSDGAPLLLQHYAQIRQLGLDTQLTLGDWLLKAEAIRRAGAYNLVGRRQDYTAAVVGAEHALYALAGTDADLTLLGEWSYDSRGPHATPNRSPNTLQNDIFLSARVAMNDVQSTEFTASFLADVGRSTRALAFEFARRISDRWSFRTEAVALLSVDEADLHYEMRHDSFIDMSLTFNF